MDDLADALLRGPRGRRMCLEYAARTDETVHTALFWLGHELDPNPGTLFRLIGDTSDPEPDPTFSADDLAARIDDVDLTHIRGDILREALQVSVDLARYWQEPDGVDTAARRLALEYVRTPIGPLSDRCRSPVVVCEQEWDGGHWDLTGS
ncbi:MULTISPECIES: hypothetical protein [unclassified Microbacterium]|uniref:hypothetical protein n=1 Tax=unclassified Microbacterium TaxID=2609290 RepID=UPI00214B1906|nr:MULTISPECIES: hypothetical protein [unclassified Microbacterium]MCR2811294.1 hypothetical protein [Microbacterium sp. zg.B185]WIM19451.1 hypothetical protein QNO12_01180 [Microbacterium sp. zg-B185]